jgi:hypothetical protein
MRIIHGDKELVEKLGRADASPSGSGRSFQTPPLEVRSL